MEPCDAQPEKWNIALAIDPRDRRRYPWSGLNSRLRTSAVDRTPAVGFGPTAPGFLACWPRWHAYKQLLLSRASPLSARATDPFLKSSRLRSRCGGVAIMMIKEISPCSAKKSQSPRRRNPQSQPKPQQDSSGAPSYSESCSVSWLHPPPLPRRREELPQCWVFLPTPPRQN